MLPGMNGYEILTEIKPKYPKILVVLFTVKKFFEDIQKTRNLGADEYLIKGAADLAKFFKRGDNDDDRFPYPYIFKPPSPPDDLALAARAQLRQPPKKKDLEEKAHCQYCGMDLIDNEQYTHSCKKKPE